MDIEDYKRIAEWARVNRPLVIAENQRAYSSGSSNGHGNGNGQNYEPGFMPHLRSEQARLERLEASCNLFVKQREVYTSGNGSH